LTESGVAKLPSSGAIVFEFSENNSAVQNSFVIKLEGYYNKVD